MPADCSWEAVPPHLTLSESEVHIIRAHLDSPPDELDELAQTLSSIEQQRADRFHFARDRRRYIIGRGLLRIILGNYLNRQPASLRFQYSEHNKPWLVDGGKLRFNLAHSHELALYAFTLGRDVGIDLEYIKPVVDCEGIARHFFSEQERATLQALPSDRQDEAFFVCWTRKEAYVKAIGDGLTFPLDTFDVSLTPGHPAELLEVRGNQQEAARWQLRNLQPDPEYAASIVVAGNDWQARCYSWQ